MRFWPKNSPIWERCLCAVPNGAERRQQPGKECCIEVKTGGETLIEKGAATLVALEDKIDTTRMKKPAFKMLLVADGEYAYRRKDDVLVCPIAALRP